MGKSTSLKNSSPAQSRRHGGALVGLSPQTKLQALQMKMKHCKLVEDLSNLNVKPPRTNVKPPYWWLSGDGSASARTHFGGSLLLITRGVTRLEGGRGQKKVWRPHARTWGLSETNALYWRNDLWHCWDFTAPPAVIRCPGICAPLPPPRYAPAHNASYTARALLSRDLEQ